MNKDNNKDIKSKPFHDEDLIQQDLQLLGVAYKRKHPDGTIERIPPEEMMIITRANNKEVKSAEKIFYDRIYTNHTAGFQKREIIEAMQEYASQQTASLQSEVERLKGEVIHWKGGYDAANNTISEQSQRIAELKEALKVILERDFAAMLVSVPEGIIHRADLYNSPDHFEDNGSYEEYARYTAPARNKIIDAYIDKALNPSK